jgi:hypothetical protein
VPAEADEADQLRKAMEASRNEADEVDRAMVAEVMEASLADTCDSSQQVQQTGAASRQDVSEMNNSSTSCNEAVEACRDHLNDPQEGCSRCQKYVKDMDRLAEAKRARQTLVPAEADEADQLRKAMEASRNEADEVDRAMVAKVMEVSLTDISVSPQQVLDERLSHPQGQGLACCMAMEDSGIFESEDSNEAKNSVVVSTIGPEPYTLVEVSSTKSGNAAQIRVELSTQATLRQLQEHVCNLWSIPCSQAHLWWDGFDRPLRLDQTLKGSGVFLPRAGRASHLQLLIESPVTVRSSPFIPRQAHSPARRAPVRASLQEPEQRMCANCGAGPMVNLECSNLKSHHEAGFWRRGRNACPACGSFRSNWNDLPLWDGGTFRQQQQERKPFWQRFNNA